MNTTALPVSHTYINILYPSPIFSLGAYILVHTSFMAKKAQVKVSFTEGIR